jgi:hypothetical protein
MLDYAYPIVSDSRPSETTQARIQYLLGNCGTVSSMGTGPASLGVSYIQTMSGVMQPAMTLQRETLRTAIEKCLGLEATATQQPNYYLDPLFQFHAFYGLGDVSSSLSLVDVNPDGVVLIPYGEMTVTYDGTSDADSVYVYGVNQTGSGLVSNGIPRSPKRVGSIDSSASDTPATAIAAGQAQLGLVQGVTRLQVTVTGYDGWAKGQSIAVTNNTIGILSVYFWVAGVSMRTLSSTGYREYTLQMNASLPRFSRITSSAIRPGVPILGQAIQGQLGGY